MSECENRSAMSVSYEKQRTEDRTYGGHAVEVVLQANLVEISMCHAGKVATAFNFITDAARYDKPVAGHRSLDFAVSHAAHRVKRAVAKSAAATNESNAALNARLDNIDAQLGINKPGACEGFSQACRDLTATLDRIHTSLSGLKV
jgi:hypothetical protein